MRRLIYLATSLLLGAGIVQAQDGKAPAAAPPVAEPEDGERDPFRTPEPMRRGAALQDLPGGDPAPRAASPLPRLTIVGYMKMRGKEPAALVHDGERAWVVRSGDPVVLRRDGVQLRYRVARIDPNLVVFEPVRAEGDANGPEPGPLEIGPSAPPEPSAAARRPAAPDDATPLPGVARTRRVGRIPLPEGD